MNSANASPRLGVRPQFGIRTLLVVVALCAGLAALYRTVFFRPNLDTLDTCQRHIPRPQQPLAQFPENTGIRPVSSSRDARTGLGGGDATV